MQNLVNQTITCVGICGRDTSKESYLPEDDSISGVKVFCKVSTHTLKSDLTGCDG